MAVRPRVPGKGDLAAVGGDLDDPPAALGPQVRQRGPDELDRPSEVGGDDVADLLIGQFLGRAELLEVELIFGCRRVHLLHAVRTDDLFLYRPAFLSARLGRGSGLPVEWQRHAALGEDVVGGTDEVEGLAHPGVGDGLVDDLLGLGRGDPLVRAAPSMTRYSLRAWLPMRAASWTMSRVLVSRLVCLSVSSKVKLPKISISSGSVTFRVETWPGNSSSWFSCAVSLIATVPTFPQLAGRGGRSRCEHRDR